MFVFPKAQRVETYPDRQVVHFTCGKCECKDQWVTKETGSLTHMVIMCDACKTTNVLR